MHVVLNEGSESPLKPKEAVVWATRAQISWKTSTLKKSESRRE